MMIVTLHGICISNASFISGGYKIPDLVGETPLPQIPLFIEPVSDDEFGLGCPDSSRVCPRLVMPVPQLDLDLRTRGIIDLRSVSSSFLSSAEKAAGANISFYIYDYVPQV